MVMNMTSVPPGGPQPFCINLTNGVKFRLTEVHRFYLKPEWLDLTTRHPLRSADHILLEVVYENWIPSKGGFAGTGTFKFLAVQLSRFSWWILYGVQRPE